MNLNDAFPSSYLSKADVEDPKTYTIMTIVIDDIKDIESGGTEKKPVLHFSESDAKPLILNKTNWLILEELFGRESESWNGKQVQLYNDPNVSFGGRRTGGVRVRSPQ